MSEAEVAIGQRPPPFELDDTEGQPRALPGPGDVEATVIVWTCNHCPYALAWHDRLAEVAEDYADRGVELIMVNSNDAERYPADSPAAMRERHRTEEWDFPYLHDPEQSVAAGWGAKTTPDVYVLDGGGYLAYRGAPDADHQRPELSALWLRDALDAVLAGRDPERAETEPVGCSIKWRP